MIARVQEVQVHDELRSGRHVERAPGGQVVHDAVTRFGAASREHVEGDHVVFGARAHLLRLHLRRPIHDRVVPPLGLKALAGAERRLLFEDLLGEIAVLDVPAGGERLHDRRDELHRATRRARWTEPVGEHGAVGRGVRARRGATGEREEHDQQAGRNDEGSHEHLPVVYRGPTARKRPSRRGVNETRRACVRSPRAWLRVARALRHF